MGEQPLPSGWRSDEQGNVYRVLTPSEQAQIERARSEPARGDEDAAGDSPEPAASAASALTRAS